MNNLHNDEQLHPDLADCIQKSVMGKIIKHPLIILPYTEGQNAFINTNYDLKVKKLQEALDSKNWNFYVFLHERPFRIKALLKIKENLNNKEYWELLGQIWIDSENLWEYSLLMNSLLSVPDSHEMMTVEEQEFLNSLPDRFVVYRGVINKKLTKGFSWTLSPWKAKWFSARFVEVSHYKVIKGVVNKKDVIACLLRRNEFEIVVNPSKVKVVINKIYRPKWLENIILENYNLGKRKGYHNLWHWENVESNVINLNVPKSDPFVTRIFALIHDSKRINEDHDENHGERAATYAKELYQQKKIPINNKQLDLLIEACANHEKGLITDNPTIGACWDADRLDLLRVGIIPDKNLLSTLEAKSMIYQI